MSTTTDSTLYLSGDALDDAVSTLRTAQRPLLFCHRSPDGDTVGAAIALAMALRYHGKTPSIVCPDPLPSSLHFIPDTTTITSRLATDADLLVTIDVSDLSMLGTMRVDLEHLRERTPLLNIDHHASDTAYGDVNIVDTTAASTAEIVYEVVQKLAVPITTEMATALLTGIINDTHSFQNANSSARALATAAKLVSAGAEPAPISLNLLLRHRPQAALLWGAVLASLRLDDDGRVASAVATQEMLQSCNADATDLDGIVEFLRNIDGVDMAFLLKGTSDNQFKASIRTTDRVDAIDLTAPFSGGGHHRAAGCDVTGAPEEARAALIARYYQLMQNE